MGAQSPRSPEPHILHPFTTPNAVVTPLATPRLGAPEITVIHRTHPPKGIAVIVPVIAQYSASGGT
jgi:hypothetical protein